MGTGNNKFRFIANNKILYQGKEYKLYTGPTLSGPRHEVGFDSPLYPAQLRHAPRPPQKLYIIGDVYALHDGLSVIGARKATPYGLACVDLFAGYAAERGIHIVSGGAYGCDSRAHRAALDRQGKTVAFLGGGCDQVYPASNYRLFQDIIDAGGAVVSEHDWTYPALPFTFRERNRLIAACSRAVLIVEAGLPSGTFSTADAALAAGRDVLVVPGAITSKTSAGSNQLLFQGAIPICDIESFSQVLFSIYGLLREKQDKSDITKHKYDPLLEALQAQPLRFSEILDWVEVPRRISTQPTAWLQTHLVELEAEGLIARFPDGRYGPAKVAV